MIDCDGVFFAAEESARFSIEGVIQLINFLYFVKVEVIVLTVEECIDRLVFLEQRRPLKLAEVALDRFH